MTGTLSNDFALAANGLKPHATPDTDSQEFFVAPNLPRFPKRIETGG